MSAQGGKQEDEEGKIRRIPDASSSAKRFGDGELSLELTPNGSHQTGTLTIAHPDYEPYTGDINLEKRSNRNGFAKEAAELYGYEEAKLRRAFVRLCTQLNKEMALAKERKDKKAQKAKRERSPEEQAETWETSRDLASKEDILEEFRRDLKEGGFAGETKDAELLFLALISRFLDKMVNVVPKGPSAGGKSFLVETVLSYFPKSAYYTLSSLSEHALVYIDEPLANRFLIIAEAAGAEGQKAAYFLRTLLSEGRIEHWTNFRDPKTGKITPTRIVIEGPVGMITTTTAIRLHPENETRFISLSVSDTEEQTKEIIRAKCQKESGKEEEAPTTSRSCWHALQTWLEEGAEHHVIIPYALELGELIPAKAVRLRRDIDTILGLIKAHAILHQATRERDGKGRIIATLADYAAVRRLIGEIIDDGVEAAVPKTVRETVKAVGILFLSNSEGEPVAAKAVAEELELDRSSASRRIRRALDLGYLKNLEDKKGRPMRLVPGDPMPEDTSILPVAALLEPGPDNNGPDTPNGSATVQPHAESRDSKPNSAVAHQKEARATVQPLDPPEPPVGCAVAPPQKGSATAKLAIDTGNSGSGCTVACQERLENAKKTLEESGSDLLDSPTIEGVVARAEREGRLLTNPASVAPPSECAEESERSPEEDGTAGTVGDRERIRALLEDPPGCFLKQADRCIQGGIPELLLKPLASSLAHEYLNNVHKWRDVLPLLEKYLRERRDSK